VQKKAIRNIGDEATVIIAGFYFTWLNKAGNGEKVPPNGNSCCERIRLDRLAKQKRYDVKSSRRPALVSAHKHRQRTADKSSSDVRGGAQNGMARQAISRQGYEAPSFLAASNHYSESLSRFSPCFKTAEFIDCENWSHAFSFAADDERMPLMTSRVF